MTDLEVMAEQSKELELSNGHICFANGFEYYELFGEVYRAPLSAVFDLDTKARIGRWECSRAQFDRFRAVLVGAN